MEWIGVVEVGVATASLLLAVRWYIQRPREQLLLTVWALETAIYAVEQMSKSGSTGNRRVLAAQLASQELSRYGLKVSAEELETGVEATLYRLLNQWKEAPRPAAD